MTTKILNDPKKDCFAYSKERNNCKALDRLYCRFEECKFYKTEEERCEGCRKSSKHINCTDCVKNGWK